MEEQPEALRLIKHMDDEWQEDWDGRAIRAELRRLHAENQALRQALEQNVARSDTSPERVEKEAANKHIAAPAQVDHFAGAGKPMLEQPAPAQKPLGYIATMALNDLQDSIYGDVAVYGEELADTVPIYTTPPAPAQEPAETAPEDLLLRGILASELKFWHRLSEDEARNLVAFVKNMPFKPAPAQAWVDLTVTEQNELCRELGASRHQVRAIAAKLKEKNTKGAE